MPELLALQLLNNLAAMMSGRVPAESPSTSADSGFESLPGGEMEERLFVLPAFDGILLGDDRVLASLAAAASPVPDYWALQADLKPSYRAILVEWMTDVCTELGLDVEVLPVAVAVLDRFLSLQPVYKHQLQAVGTASLFIASKVRPYILPSRSPPLTFLLVQLKEPVPVRGPKLVEFTDNAIQFGELLVRCPSLFSDC